MHHTLLHKLGFHFTCQFGSKSCDDSSERINAVAEKQFHSHFEMKFRRIASAFVATAEGGMKSAWSTGCQHQDTASKISVRLMDSVT